MKIEAKKNGKGNIVISEYSFEIVLSLFDNQKFVGEQPQNGDSISVGEDEYWKGQQGIQNTIDHYNRECRKILHQKYVLRTEYDGYFLAKKYEHQTDDTEWTSEDVGLVYELFKDTIIIYSETRDLLPLDGSEEIMEGTEPIGKTKDGWIAVKPDPTPWLIERPLRYDYQYLTISEDGKTNRPWKQEEIEKKVKLYAERKMKLAPYSFFIVNEDDFLYSDTTEEQFQEIFNRLVDRKKQDDEQKVLLAKKNSELQKQVVNAEKKVTVLTKKSLEFEAIAKSNVEHSKRMPYSGTFECSLPKQRPKSFRPFRGPSRNDPDR
jgi:hypothetical protein